MRRRSTAPVSALPILLLALIVLAAFAGPALAQSDPIQTEFPAQDHSVWWYMDRGLKASRARQALARSPATIDAVRLAAAAEDVDGTLRAMRAVVERDPASVADVVDAARGAFHLLSRSTTALAELRRVADLARGRVPSSPRELAARSAHAVLTLDLLLDRAPMDRRRQALRQLARAWADTETGSLAEVEAITSGPAGAEMLDALEGVVRDHPRSPAAARALFEIGFQWHTINLLGTLEPRDADPTARFFRVLETASALESGAYPDSEWVRRAPDLVGGFFFPDAAPMSADNATRILDAAERFVVAHLDPLTGLPARNALFYFVTSKMPALHGRAGNGAAAGMERSFERLRRAAPSAAAIDYLHGQYVLERLRNEAPGPAARTALVADARHWFGAAAAADRSAPARYALATLAALEFQERQFAAAQEAYERYVVAYPASPWTWVARLRIGQCQEAVGEEQKAAATYVATARLHTSQPMARVLGHAYAGRALEELGRFRDAASEYRRALAGWDLAYGVTYTSSVSRPVSPDDPFVQSSDAGEVIKPVLARRLARLEQSLQRSGGEDLERGRVLLERGRYSEARSVFERLAGSPRDADVLGDAQRLAREARLAQALLLADRDRTDADERRAIAELDALALDLRDFAGIGAAIARASQHWLEGRDGEATSAMERAMTAWHDMAPAAGSNASAGKELWRDVADIRRLVFLPRGGPLFERRSWNAFSFADATWPFALVDADILVRFADGDATRIPVTERLDVQPRVLFVSRTEIETLHAMLTRLGGRKVRVPVAIMETPNQPAGDSRRILALWTRYFHARGGHWGGWEVEAYPKVTKVAFSDRARTRAVVHVTIGYSGCEVEVEKRDGRWSAVRILSYWIT